MGYLFEKKIGQVVQKLCRLWLTRARTESTVPEMKIDLVYSVSSYRYTLHRE